MQKYFESFIDSTGKPVAGAIVAVTTYPGGAVASIYQTNSANVAIPGGQVVTDSLGYFEFYAPDGRYTLSFTSSGTEPRIIPDVLIEDPADGATEVSATNYPTLQAALDTRKVVRLADGVTYPVTAQLTIPAGGGLIGRGILTFNSTDFANTTPGDLSAQSIVLSALSVNDVTLRDFQMVGTCGVNSWIYPIALRGVTKGDLRGLEISGLNAGTMIKIDSSFDIKVQRNILRDATLDRNISGGQLSGVTTDDHRMNGVGSERLDITHNTLRNLSWTPAFLATYGPQSDGVNLQVGTRNCLVAHNVFEGLGEGVDCFGDDNIIADNITKNALGYSYKLIHGASRNLLDANVSINSGLGGVVVAGSNTASKNTDSNTILNTVISGAGTDPGAYWAQTKYGVAINNDGVFKATNTYVRGTRVVSSPSATCAYLSSTSGTGNVYEGNYSDGTAPVEYQGSGVTVYKPNQFGGVLTGGRVASFDQFGALTLRYDDNSLTVPKANRNYGITAAGQGFSDASYFGTGSALGGQAHAIDVTATDTWAAPANRSAKITFKAAQGGSLVAVADADPAKGLCVMVAGLGLRVKEGTNAKQGVTTLVAGADGVSNTSVTASSRIFVTSQSNGVTGALRAVANPGIGFSITSNNAADAGVVAWQIFEPA